MKKSQLRKIIRESIKEVMLNENVTCGFDYHTGDCEPADSCETVSVGYDRGFTGEYCRCKGNPNKIVCTPDDCPGCGDNVSDPADINKTITRGGEPVNPFEPTPTDSLGSLNEDKIVWCTCKTRRCKRDPQQGGPSSLSWGGCTGSGACDCINKGHVGSGGSDKSIERE
jgi:hypothetical protein